ncbi:MAG TPA: NAD(P)H-binding protein [Candidatus Limnocylindrales bacterium]|nr:NAD(P)H-binding protein [Candidatus Limnocylindrales bacterium]
MAERPLDAVTGAFSFTGRAIAAHLLAEGREVMTLVRRAPSVDPFGGRVRAVPFDVDDPLRLGADLAGVDTLYNTFWIRFPRGDLTYEVAVERTLRLVEAATRARVRRLVHVSVVNASETGPTAYFAAKARLEREIRGSGLSHAIVRPTLTYGEEDILVNNLCWILRRFPILGVPGDGTYRLQPVHVDDVAAICVRAGRDPGDPIVDAAGPEILVFDDFVRLLGGAVDSRTRVLHLPPPIALAASGLIGIALRDVVLTADEVTELTGSVLVSSAPPAGTTSFPSWVEAHADRLGRRYHSELARHYRPPRE